MGIIKNFIKAAQKDTTFHANLADNVTAAHLMKCSYLNNDNFLSATHTYFQEKFCITPINL